MTGINDYPNPGNYPSLAFPQPVPPPDIDPDEGDLIYVGYNPLWQEVLMGALWALLAPSTWQGTDEEIITALNRAENFRFLLTEPVALDGDVPAPFWDDADGEDAGDELPPAEQPWYEELSHWVIAGFLALTFTPAAAVFYLTYIRPARIAFLGRRYGAVVDILIDGVMHDQVDTYSETDTVIYYDLNIPVAEGFAALDVTEYQVQIRHSGEHNADATPTDDGYSIAFIRDYIGRDTMGRPVTRINPDTGEFETTPDNGETWIDNPEADPRNQITFPPLTGDDITCRAANSIVAQLEQQFDTWLDQLQEGASFSAGAWLLMAILQPVFWGAAVITVAVALTTFVLGAGASTVRDALTPDVWEKLRCIFLVLVDGEGRMPEANMSRLYDAIYEEIGGLAAQVLDLHFDTLGFGGLSNMAAQDADPLAGCGCCPAVAESAGDDFTDGGKWDTFIGETFSYPGQLVGVYDPTVGRTALGSVKGTPQPGTPSSKNAYVTFHLGTPCRVQTVQFYTKSSLAPGGTPAQWVIAWYNEAGGLMGVNTGTVSSSPTWVLRSNAMNTTGISFVTVAFNMGTPGDIWLDDVSFILGG